MTTRIPLPDRGPRYLRGFDTRDLPRYGTDVLVIGGGVAGLSAALAAAPHARVSVLTKGAVESSNTALAQGGIAAAMDPADSPESHAQDTIRTGAGLCDPEVVRCVVANAPAAVEELLRRGAEFDRIEGALDLGREGGHDTRRIVHARGDATGAECVRALVAAVRGTRGIRFWERTFVVDLLTHEGRCVGALIQREDGELAALLARAVVLAAGGAGRLYRETTNAPQATGDGIAAAYRAGTELADLEFVQFHPTTLYLAGTPRLLVTEAVRGEGAHLVDDQGQRFLTDVHPDAELAPRDVVARAIVDRLARPDVEHVYLDLTHLPAARAEGRFPGLAATCERYGLHLASDRIPVRPAAHYFIGGVMCDLDGRASLPGLWACGEATCSGLHGANRLASNSLLEGLVLGARAGRSAACEAGEPCAADLAYRPAPGDAVPPSLLDVQDLRGSLSSLMWRSVGIRRNGESLLAALASIEQWRSYFAAVRAERREDYELANLLQLGALVAHAAVVREESRGTHWRDDHPVAEERCRGSRHYVRGEPARFVEMPKVARG